MKIDVRRQRLDEFSHWSKEKEHPEYLVARKPPKGTPTIEVLLTEPPKYRINGQIVDVPKGMSPEEYYERYMGRDIFRDEEEENGKSWAVLKNKESDRDIDPGFYRDNKKEESFEGLHPLRKQYLENRLKDIDYQERRQATQDDFTTRMYGKKDYAEERHNILQELNGKSAKQFANEQQEQLPSESKPTFTPAAPDEPSDFDRRKELWENQKRWDEFQKSQHEGQSVEDSKEPNAFERLGVPDPKNPQESISEADKNRRDFYKFPQPNGQSTEAWDRANEYLRNTPREDKEHNIIGSEIRCNTTIGRELSKLGIDVEKGVNMNKIIDGMDKSGDWANLPTDKNGNPDHKEATKLAKEGYIVVATEKGKEHGHAAILTGKEAESGTWKGKVPEVYGSVNGKPAKSEGISNHWQAKDKNNIKYKVYRYKRPI